MQMVFRESIQTSVNFSYCFKETRPSESVFSVTIMRVLLSQGSSTLLRPRPHSRRWAAGKRAKLHLRLPMARITAWPSPPAPVRAKKLSSTKPVPGTKKVGDRCSKSHFKHTKMKQLTLLILYSVLKTTVTWNQWKTKVILKYSEFVLCYIKSDFLVAKYEFPPSPTLDSL